MTASKAFLQTWRLAALSSGDMGAALEAWDTWDSRLFRYTDATHFIDNTLYLERLQKYTAMMRADLKLYKHIKPFKNPAGRLVRAYQSTVYSGVLDMENLSKGALPIVGASDSLKAAIRQTLKWSNWGEMMRLYVRNGAMYGDSFIKVIDQPAKHKVRFEILHPALFKEIEFDEVGNIVRCLIEYEESETLSNGQSKAYTHSEEITKTSFATFRDGEPFAYYHDAHDQPVSSWANDYGFVPVVHVRHQHIGKEYGANAWHGVSYKIHLLNDLYSVLNRQVRKTVTPIFAGIGVQKGRSGELDVSGDEESVSIIHLPEDARLDPAVISLPISEVLEMLADLEGEIEQDLPELALAKIRETGNLTAPGVLAAYGDAVDRFVEARIAYDNGFIRAQQMAVSIGGFNRYAGFESFSLDDYDKGNLEFQIAERPVIRDSLATSERIGFIMQATSLPPAEKELVYKELGLGEEDTKGVFEEADTRENAALAAIANALINGGNDAQSPTNPTNSDSPTTGSTAAVGQPEE